MAQQKMKLAESRQRSKVMLERSRLIMVQELRREEQERKEQISNVKTTMREVMKNKQQ